MFTRTNYGRAWSRLVFIWVLLGAGAIGQAARFSGAGQAAVAVAQPTATPQPATTAETEPPPAGALCYTEEADPWQQLLEQDPIVGDIRVKIFDETLGDLVSITVRSSISVETDVEFMASADLLEPQTLIASAGYQAKLSSPGGVADINDFGLGKQVGDQLGPLDPGETDSATLVGELASASGTLADLNDAVDDFFPFVFDALVKLSFDTGGKGEVRYESRVVVEASATYCYVPFPEPGALTIVKVVEAGEGADVGPFSFAIDCSNGFTTQAEVAGEGSVVVDLGILPDGTTCGVAEVFADSEEARRWAVEIDGVCAQAAPGVEPGTTVTFTNRLRDSYDRCPASE